MRLNLVMVFAIAVVAAVPQLASAHLLNGAKGPVDAFNYDEKLVGHLNGDCSQLLECRQTDIKDVFFFNCYYDVKSGECQCSKGEFSQCNSSSSSLSAREVAAIKGGSNGVLGLAGAVVANLTKLAKLAYVKFAALPLFAKAVIVVIALVAVIFILRRFRDNAANNFRKARELHGQASELHDAGNEEEARLRFEKSGYHREKAYEQMQEKV